MINILGLQNIIKPEKVTKKVTHNHTCANFVQKPDTFEHSSYATSPISFTGKSNRLKEYHKITDNLNQTAEKAQTSLNKQLDSDTWAGKTADTISVLWNSKNRATLVQADIDKFKENISDLDESIKTDKFNDKFKEIFDVDFSHSNIINYDKKSKAFETALTADCIAKFTEEKLSKTLDIYNKNAGKLQDFTEKKINTCATTGSIPYYNHITPKEEIFKNMENSLAEVLGGKENLDKILSSKGFDNSKATDDDKYKLYGYLSNYIVKTSKITAEKSLKGQTLNKVKEDCDKAYEKAYGTKNDIIARVDKYNASQKAGSACVKFITNVVLNTLGPSSVLASCIYSAGKSVAMDIADAKTKNKKEDINFKLLATNAGLNGVGGIANRIIVNNYAGSVASKILAGKAPSDSLGSILTDFVVKEIISKEGVKLPAYAVEEIADSVVKKMLGLKTEENGSGLSQAELKNAMVVVSEAMAYFATEKNNQNSDKMINEKEMVSLLKNHISKTMANNAEFNKWLNENKSAYNQLLAQLVKTL